MGLHTLYNGKAIIKFDGRKHCYTWENEITADGTPLKIPGVTTILSFAAKEALIPWAANMAADYYKNSLLDGYDVSNKETVTNWTVQEIEDIHKDAKKAYAKKMKGAADVGSAVHSYAEQRLKGEAPNVPAVLKFKPEDIDKYQMGCSAFDMFVKQHDIDLFSSERVIFSQRFLYAGTTDFFGKIDKEVCVLDFKTSSGLYPEMALQVAAYQIALEEELDRVIPARWLVRFDKETGQCHAIRLPRNREHEEAFLALREFAGTMTRMKKNWKVI